MAAYSMAGYSWRTWLSRNKDQLKLLIAAMGGVATAWISGHLLGAWAALAGTGAAVATRMLLDAVDYWLGEQSGQ
jgi:hypothetical protein